MDDVAVGKRIDEIKHLLERIDRRAATRFTAERQALSSGGADLSARGHRASPTDLLIAEYKDSPGGGGGAGLGAWIFVLATMLNTVVVAAIAALVLGLVEVPGFRHTRAIRTPDAAIEAPSRTAYPVELAHVGSRESPLRVRPGETARIPVTITRGNTSPGSFLILSGLPPSAAVAGATRVGKDMWLLLFQAGADLKLTVADETEGVVRFQLQLRYANGVAAAQTEGWLAVQDAAAQASPANSDAADITEMVSKGETLLAKGDIVGARSLYERAADAGSAEAALALGATYDPNRLWFLGRIGMAGNRERARQWYLRAEELGHPEAGTRLNALVR